VAAATRVSAAPAALERALPLLKPDARPADPEGAVRSGYLDLLGEEEPASTGIAQNLMLTGVVPTVYERWWRPALGRVAKGLLGPGMADEHRIARLLLGLTPGDGVLDVACGPGNFTRRFAHLLGQAGLAVGIDASVTMLERAVRDSPDPFGNLLYLRGNAVELPFRDRSFDAVCCFAALHLRDEIARHRRQAGAALDKEGFVGLCGSGFVKQMQAVDQGAADRDPRKDQQAEQPAQQHDCARALPPVLLVARRHGFPSRTAPRAFASRKRAKQGHKYSRSLGIPG